MIEKRHTVCRICHAACDLVVSVENGKPVAIHGNKDNPAYHGYSCIKGRAAGALLEAPSRLLHSMQRQPDGSHRKIPSGRAISQVAAQLRQIIDRHGPRSVALFTGTYCTINPLFETFAKAFLRAIDSPMLFDNLTIDQPGKSTAPGLIGTWLAGTPSMDEWDALLLVGANPIVSMNGGLGVNPARRLKQMQARGMKLVVVDPRRTECAARADIHLQPRPGEDAAIIAGLIRQILVDAMVDQDFVDAETTGIEELAAAVMPFTPAMVAQRAGIEADALVKAARVLGKARCGATSFGTGANMSGDPSTVEYLGRVLASLRGWWRRPGDQLANPGVFLQPLPPIAATPGPMAVEGVGARMEARGVTGSLAGNPVSALPDEILTTGPGKIRALIVAGGNPVLAWPDQAKTVQALADLDLLVCIDPFMSATSEMADYVLASRLGLECETNSAANEKWGLFNPGWGYEQPYGQSNPPVVAPPEDSDLREDWEFFYDLAQAMGLPLELHSIALVDPQEAAANAIPLDMTRKPSTSEAWASAFTGSPVPYEDMRRHPGPRLVDRAPVTVQPKPEGWTGRLELAAPLIMERLSRLGNPPPLADGAFPFRLICRRLQDVVNSCGHDNPIQLRKWTYNPAFMHPSDLEALGLSAGDTVTIRSAHGAITGIVEVDAGLRAGCVSMPHSWGRHPGREQRLDRDGANTGRLIAIDRDIDALTGQPLMSAIPVSVSPATAPAETPLKQYEAAK
ncbi:molybdopterin-containing oxidoreductase family protein [Novosphingobium malaysiense]|uniref:molybdopterin-containing oxidoreductase family protein n=1 Tax=Novosphingobium malaysiense TaxID=1348853 RepID=UPI0006904D4C|nr:molybdopterin-dependent oxidoreductase [Novosphingobium malaysiense]